MKKTALLLIFISLTAYLTAADFYQTGLQDYREGRNEQALVNLKKALEADPSNDGACLYLAVIYQKMGNVNQAETYYIQGRSLSGLHFMDMTFNLANLYFNQQRYDEAEELYERLLLSPGTYRVSSLLNLANLSVQSGNPERAVDLYIDYLNEDPDTPQRPQIEQMIALLTQSIDRAEQQKLAEEARIREAEEAARQAEEAEQQRLAEQQRQQELEEQQRLEEEARQRELLDSILSSLESSGQETKNFTADSEKVQEVFEASDLDD